MAVLWNALELRTSHAVGSAEEQIVVSTAHVCIVLCRESRTVIKMYTRMIQGRMPTESENMVTKNAFLEHLKFQLI